MIDADKMLDQSGQLNSMDKLLLSQMLLNSQQIVHLFNKSPKEDSVRFKKEYISLAIKLESMFLRQYQAFSKTIRKKFNMQTRKYGQTCQAGNKGIIRGV